MKTMINAFLTIALLAMVVTVPAMAQNDTRVTYIHTDADGTPFAATDEQGNLEWQIEHLPFGGEHSNTEVRRNNNLSFAGKIYDKDIGLSYFGGRWYDPASGRFTGIDPMPVNAEDWKTFNRYAYGNNNPYKYVDPDGNLPFLIPIAIFLAKEGLAEVASRYTGGATDLLSVRRMGSKLLKKSLQLLKRNKCFVAGTPVHTKEGLKSIEDIQIGDLVASKNDETGEIDFKPVTELFVNKDKQVLNITFVDNNQQQELIGTTEEHPFWVEGKGWTEAGDLNIGDKVTSLDGGVLSVQAMASDAQLQTTYNFEVEEFHTYFVGKRALWVHNSCGEVGFDDAIRARDEALTEIRSQSKTQQRKVATVVGAVNTKTGKIGVGIKKTGCDRGKCAEDLAKEAVGGNSADILLSPAVRPRLSPPNDTINVCKRCQGTFKKDQFPSGTKFD